MGFFAWLFGGSGKTAGASEDEAAAQLARLLVSELVLYNEKALEEARRRGKVGADLKSDIERSRRMYDERVPPNSVQQDYFYLELVSRLAGGEAEILGLEPHT